MVSNTLIGQDQKEMSDKSRKAIQPEGSRMTFLPSALRICLQPRLILTFGHLTPKVELFTPSPRGPLIMPPPLLSGDRRPSSVCPSVCLSDVAYIGSNSKTKRPRKMKLCTGVPQVTCDSHTDFKVKRSKVKVGRGHIVAAT